MSSESLDPIAARALDVIRQGAHEPTLTRAVVAADVDVAESTLAHHVKHVTGWSIREHVGRHRVRIVEGGLLAGSKTIRVLAAEAGFASLSVCDYWFRRVHGVPPLVWLMKQGGRPLRTRR